MCPEVFEVFFFFIFLNMNMTYEWASCARELKLSRTSRVQLWRWKLAIRMHLIMCWCLASGFCVVGIRGWIDQKWFKWIAVAGVAKLNVICLVAFALRYPEHRIVANIFDCGVIYDVSGKWMLTKHENGIYESRFPINSNFVQRKFQ